MCIKIICKYLMMTAISNYNCTFFFLFTILEFYTTRKWASYFRKTSEAILEFALGITKKRKGLLRYVDFFLLSIKICTYIRLNIDGPNQELLPNKWDHGLRTPGEEIPFTARPKINSHSQIFKYGWIFFVCPTFQNSLIYAFIGCP